MKSEIQNATMLMPIKLNFTENWYSCWWLNFNNDRVVKKCTLGCPMTYESFGKVRFEGLGYN